MKLQIAVVLFLATNAFAGIEINFDRFTNKTVVATPGMDELISRADSALTPSWFTQFTGQQPTALPSKLNLTFWKVNKSWKYLRCHDVVMLADGSPFPLDASKHDGTVGRGYVMERVGVDVSFAKAEELSRAKLVEFKICNTEGRFSEGDMEDLRNFVKALTP